MKRLLIGCFGLLVIIAVMAAVILWWCRPEGRPLAPDEVKGYDYSATTASGVVLTVTSTLFFGNSTTPAQQTVSSATVRNPVISTPLKTGIWRTFIDYLSGESRISINQVKTRIAIRIWLLFWLTFIFGGLIWIGFYTADPHNDRVYPFLHFCGGLVIGSILIYCPWTLIGPVVLAVFYGLSRLYQIKMKKMWTALFVSISLLIFLAGTIYFAYLFINSIALHTLGTSGFYDLFKWIKHLFN